MKRPQKLSRRSFLARSAAVGAAGATYLGVELPKQRRETRIVRDIPVEEIAREIVAWLKS